jgi:pyruvate/2-oxoglutarate dehydrogenase complex dihydrolipoamide acyltransferase (E2) component
MPALVAGVTTAKLAQWVCKVGDLVVTGKVIAKVEIGLLSYDVAAQSLGRLTRILVEAGTPNVMVSTPIAMLGAPWEPVEGVKAAAAFQPGPLGAFGGAPEGSPAGSPAGSLGAFVDPLGAIPFTTAWWQRANQPTLAAALVTGNPVAVQPIPASEVSEARSHVTSPAFNATVATLATKYAQTPVLEVHPAARQALLNSVGPQQSVDMQRVLITAGSGAITGAGVGALFSLLGTASGHPVALTFISAVIGTGVGVAVGSGTKLTVWPHREHGFMMQVG